LLVVEIQPTLLFCSEIRPALAFCSGLQPVFGVFRRDPTGLGVLRQDSSAQWKISTGIEVFSEFFGYFLIRAESWRATWQYRNTQDGSE